MTAAAQLRQLLHRHNRLHCASSLTKRFHTESSCCECLQTSHTDICDLQICTFHVSSVYKLLTSLVLLSMLGFL